MNFGPKDILAGVVTVGYVVLKLAGKDGSLDGAFMLIVGYYFAKRQNGEDKGK